MERCWVCDGMPVAKGCPACFGRGKIVIDGQGHTSPCGRCHGKAQMPIPCPGCKGTHLADPPHRADPEWRDPLECGMCHGKPDCTERGTCDTCGNRGRIYLVFPETDFVDDLRQCVCVTTPACDPRRGAAPDCPLCCGYGVMYIVRRMFLDAHVARHFLITPPPDIAHAFLARQWERLAPLAPPLWPHEDRRLQGGAA